MDKPGNISYSKTQEDMEQQQHQNDNKDTTLQKPGCVSADIRMRKLDPESRVRKKNSRI